MYILKNALVSIKRNKGRNILIGLIIMVISASCAITLSIMNSANKIVKSYDEKYNVEASISMNRANLVKNLKEDDNTQEEMINKFNEIKNPTADEIENYGNSEYVKSFYYFYNISMNADGITEAADSLVKETTEITTRTESFGGGEHKGGRPDMPSNGESKKTTTTKKTTSEIKNMKAANGAYKILGYSSLESMSNFINGSYTIVDGSISSDFSSNECVISEELATLNNLNVGDTIKLVNPSNKKLTYELTISGIYKENTESSNDMSSMFSSSANTIITNKTVVEKMLADDTELNSTITPTFIMKDATSLDKFKEEVVEKGLSEYYTITDNISTITDATKSVTNVKTFAKTFLIITLIIGGLVLFVINMINIRERKYEIGVLRTIGMKKISVAFQFILELLIVAIVSLSIGAFIGSFTSVNVANNLLKTEIQNNENEYKNINNNFGGKDDKKGFDINKMNGISKIESVNSINAIVDIYVLAELLGIGIILTIISASSSIIAINRFSPLSILKERS